MSDVAMKDENKVAVQDQRNFFEQYGDAVTPTVLVGKLLRFTKFGDYTAGQENEKIPHGTQMIANMNSLRVGWIKWQDNKPAENKMGLVMEGYKPVRRDELGDTDEDLWDTFDDGRAKDPWQFTNQIVLMDEDGQLYTFATASRGGLGAIGEISKAYGKRMRMNPNEHPVISLGMREYKHSNPAYGLIRTPQFDVVDWSELPDQLANLQGASGEDVSEVQVPAKSKLQIENKAAAAKPTATRTPTPAAKPRSKPSFIKGKAAKR
jgi:hypothetical protein